MFSALRQFLPMVGVVSFYNVPVFSKHISLTRKPPHLDTACANKCKCLVPDSFMFAVDGFSTRIFLRDVRCKFNVLAFAVPADSGNFLSGFQCFQSTAECQSVF